MSGIPEKALIASIINLAIQDLVSEELDLRISAARFLDGKDEIFCIYCGFLDIEPEYLSKKIYQYLRKGKINKISKLMN